MHVVPTEEQLRQRRVTRLVGLFTENHGPGCKQRGGEWSCDPYWSFHGLAWWFPQVVSWIGVRSTTGRRGAGGALAVPIDLGALDFVSGRYWTGDAPPDEATIADEENYRDGFVPTVLALEQSTRIALGLGRRPRPRAEGYLGLGVDPRVAGALHWLAEHMAMVVDEDRTFLEELLREEALRLLARSAATLYGSRFEATRNPCMHCHQVDSVIADEDRAFCVNPVCRDRNGDRHCWRYVDLDLPDVAGYPAWLGYHPAAAKAGGLPDWQWVAVAEPDLRGRGQVSDEHLLRWASGL